MRLRRVGAWAWAWVLAVGFGLGVTPSIGVASLAAANEPAPQSDEREQTFELQVEGLTMRGRFL